MDLKTATKAKPPGDSFKDGSFDPSRIDGLLKGRRLTKPLIAAVEGPAIAGGTEILQGTDIRIAGESAKFGISEAKWSLYPMGGSAVRLLAPDPVHDRVRPAADRSPHHRRRGLGLRADRLRGARRHRAGEGARDRRGHQQQRPARRAGDPQDDPRDRGHARERRLQAGHRNGIAVFLSDDAKEGPLAFKEKRAPNFQMR